MLLASNAPGRAQDNHGHTHFDEGFEHKQFEYVY